MAKFHMIAAVAASATLALAAPAFAENASANVATVAAAKTPIQAGEKTKYCFDTESTGTRIARRVCRTKADWATAGVDVDREMKR